MIRRLLICGILAPGVAGAAIERSTTHALVETERIRQARRQQAEDRRQGYDLVRECKYESFIATRPPAGKVALTFDDGPSRDLTPWILGVLARHRVPATFFLKAERASRLAPLVTAIHRAGHVIGNHSWEHPNFHALDEAAQTRSVETADLFLSPVLAPRRLFRYPYGNSTCATNALLRRLGYGIVGWHEDSCDWAFDRTGRVDARDAALCDVAPENQANFVGHVVRSVNARRGGILLMHEIHRHTIRQLDEVITQLKRAGFAFVALDDPELRGQIH